MRQTLRSITTLAIVAMVVGVTTLAARAGEPTDQLKSRLDLVLKTVQDPDVKKGGRAAERRAVRKIAEEIFDFEDTAQRVLGRHWAQRSPSERQEFVTLFTDVFEHAYISKIDLYQGERVTYLGDTIDGTQAMVRTQFLTKQGSRVHVDYRMKQAGGRWKIYDVIIEGASLIDNYRSQFNSVILRASYDELVRRLKVIQSNLLTEEGRGPGRS